MWGRCQAMKAGYVAMGLETFVGVLDRALGLVLSDDSEIQ
jgi:hypothetical protein